MAATDTDQRDYWTPKVRAIVFGLAATSILCLLTEFYRVCPMRDFTLFIFLPSVVLLAAIAGADRLKGNGNVWKAILVGTAAGLLAAVAYDIFRLPFVFARQWGIDSVVPPMNLFKVFPRFGAMILNQPLEQAAYPLVTHLVGWAYHFSNGATFGVMYIAMIGHPAKRHWLWGVAMAVGLELGMLLTPYPNTFGISVTSLFIAVTLVAHLIFGVAMGLGTHRLQTGFARQSLPGY